MFTFTKWERRRSKHKNTLHTPFRTSFFCFLLEKHNNQWARGPNNSVVRFRNRQKKRGDAYSGSTNIIIQNTPSILQNMPSIWLPRIIFFIQLLLEKSSQYIENWHAEENWNVQRNNPVLLKLISSNFTYIIIYWSLYLCIYQSIHLLLPASCRELCYFHSYSPML